MVAGSATTREEVSPKDGDVDTRVFCTGKCTAESLLVFFVYALVVFGCTLLAKFTTWSLAVATVVPASALFTFVLWAFRPNISLQQIALVALSTLALAVPLAVALPVVRSGWVMVIRLLDFATFRPEKPWFIRPGYTLWSFVDTFFLEAALQELIKVAVVYKAFSRKLVRRPRDVIVYSAAASSVIAVVDVALQASKVVVSLRNMPKVVLVPGPSGGTAQTAVNVQDHRIGVLWTFILYHSGFIVPMQLATGAISACLMAPREFSERKIYFLNIITWPILLHGFPIFASQILRRKFRMSVGVPYALCFLDCVSSLRKFSLWVALAADISHNEAYRVLHGVNPEALDSHVLQRLGAFTALLQFGACAVMALCLGCSLVLWRILYLRLSRTAEALPANSAPIPVKAGFLFEWSDIFQRHSSSP
ncbi:transmembrane protein [Cystoisospora suis]|uniref:Transmembrane protein n=1 Tax=Cystoisospora suis TaxID=483139 RepID=A0A2C6LC42_9APIC|nr:transmembrane protein [Cystoisospora suis]